MTSFDPIPTAPREQLTLTRKSKVRVHEERRRRGVPRGTVNRWAADLALLGDWSHKGKGLEEENSSFRKYD